MPLGTDEFVGGQPAQGLQALGVVMGPQKGLLVLIEFVRGTVVAALDGGFFAGAVHALDPALGPGVGRLGEAVRHAVFSADAGKAVPAGQKLMGWGVNRTPLSVKTMCTR